MTAFELYEQDMCNGSDLVRSCTDRREYYQQLRQTLQEECMSGSASRLLDAYNQRRAAGQLERLYLLDAAAAWECYETVIERNRSMRELSRGLPFQVNGRILSWDEVQRQSDEGSLPAAVVDEELWERIAALIRCSLSRGLIRKEAQVNIRAQLVTEAVSVAPAPTTFVPSREAKLLAENEELRKLADSRAEEADGLNRELDALKKEQALLRGQLEQLRQHQETARDYAARAADSILSGKTEEARAIASRLDERLQRAVQELERAAAARRELEGTLARTQEQLEADRAQLRALRQQEQAASEAIAAARIEREQAQRDASSAVQEQQAVQAELDAVMAQLNEKTRTLRALRRKMSEARKASDLTQRQAEGLTEYM